MCGIIGGTGDRPVVPLLVEGLRRLEYRGYDSAGIALPSHGTIWRRRRAGGNRSIAELGDALTDAPPGITCGIGHSRWATHGAPSEANAHPHTDASGRLAIIHNGIIENFRELTLDLPRRGAELVSDTDTEVLAHLIAAKVAEGTGLADAVRSCLLRVDGKFAIAVIHADEPDLIVAARRGSPLVCGTDGTTSYLASDIPAIHGKAERFYVIDDDRVVELTPGEIRVTDPHGIIVQPEEREVTWDLAAAEKGGYPDFMSKEIHEQPAAVNDTLLGRIVNGRIALDQVRLSDDDLRTIDKVFVVACGSSFHAGLVAKQAIQHWCRLPVEVEIASEFRFQDPVLGRTSLVVAISQSGETIDTLEAVHHAKQQKAPVLAVCNVVDSSMARDADAVLYTRAGPEIGVASTKCHLAQLVAMQVLALYLAQVRGTSYPEEVASWLSHLEVLPEGVARALDSGDTVKGIATAPDVRDARDFFFLGRGVGRAVALEGALKLKEISYLRAEGYAAGELKHGPIALIEPGTVVVAVATRSRLLGKMLSNVEEVKARGATVILLVDERDVGLSAIRKLADHVIAVPGAGHELFQPVIDNVPLQLLAYALATARGNDVDKPRNLAKVVTVE
jgi:glucosamine--fructose-6-phosphate aminotransferase (isomerizing)